MRTEKQPPALKQGDKPKTSKNGKKSPYMDNLHDRSKKEKQGNMDLFKRRKTQERNSSHCWGGQEFLGKF